MLEGLVDKIAKSGWLDKLADPVARAASKATAARPVKNLLSGTWLGHPVHPVLTDLPIGLWTAAAVLDAVGEPGADRLIGLGCLAAVPTAAAGLSDWSETYGAERRIGVVHGLSNVVGPLAHDGLVGGPAQPAPGSGRGPLVCRSGCGDGGRLPRGPSVLQPGGGGQPQRLGRGAGRMDRGLPRG